MSQAAAYSGTGSRVLDDLADVIGEDAAMALAFRFRGLRLYIPKDPATEPRIAETIGDELAARLSDALWRTTVSIPSREIERRMVHKLCQQGLTKHAIAEQLHITERQVYRLLESAEPAVRRPRRSAPVDPRQITMF